MKLKLDVPPRLTFTPSLPSPTCPDSALRDAGGVGDVVSVCIIHSWPLLVHPGLLCKGYSSIRRDPPTLVGVPQEKSSPPAPPPAHPSAGPFLPLFPSLIPAQGWGHQLCQSMPLLTGILAALILIRIVLKNCVRRTNMNTWTYTLVENTLLVQSFRKCRPYNQWLQGNWSHFQNLKVQKTHQVLLRF